MEALGCCAAGFMCGAAGRGCKAWGSRDKGGRQEGMLGGIAMATHRWQHRCIALSAARDRGAAGANAQPATALDAAPSQPCHGLSTAGLLCDNLASGAIVPRQQPQGGWPGVFCPSPLFHPLLGNGQAAPVCRLVLFEALSCRAGPARKKPVS